MANVQHSALTDPNIHEPKGVAVATADQLYVANGAASGVWRKLHESDIDYSIAANNVTPWNVRGDTAHTSGAPQAIASGVKTIFTNNGLTAITNTTRQLGITYATNDFTPSALNASYVLRLAYKVTAAAAAGTPYVIKVALEGGSTPAQFAAQDSFIKGGGYVNDMALTFLFFTGSLNTNYPISIYITPDTNINIYDRQYLIQRIYYEG